MVLFCNNCSQNFFELSEGYFRCNDMNCDYDVCKACGVEAGLDKGTANSKEVI